MGDVVSFPISLASDLGRELTADLARYRENLLDEKAIRKKYRLADDIWEQLGDDDELIRAVEDESARRIRDGSCKREKSQQLITKAPDILDSIASDTACSPRHRVDAIKVLDTFAANGPGQSAPASDRFQIIINLGADTLKFDKSIAVDANDVDPNDASAIAAIAAKKSTESGGGDTL